MSDNYVALLGTKGGPSVRPGSSMPTSNLFVMNGQQIVVDCALGVTRGLVDQGMNLKNLSTIFISHLHSDHYLELGPLIHTAWCSGLVTMVDIYGPDGLQDYWDGFAASMKADIDLRNGMALPFRPSAQNTRRLSTALRSRSKLPTIMLYIRATRPLSKRSKISHVAPTCSFTKPCWKAPYRH